METLTRVEGQMFVTLFFFIGGRVESLTGRFVLPPVKSLQFGFLRPGSEFSVESASNATQRR